jgi:hypothetical protein
LWDELTVAEHIKIWNNIKSSQGGKVALELIEACDLNFENISEEWHSQWWSETKVTVGL